jgi:hypothetical protein
MEDTDLSWRKSSYSGNGGATCVEVGKADRVLVRDTQHRTGPVLRFSPAAWRRFADQVKRSLANQLPGLARCGRSTLTRHGTGRARRSADGSGGA